MDVDACLAEMLRLCAEIQRHHVPDSDDCDRLAELTLSLDEWIRRNGFLPTRWKRV